VRTIGRLLLVWLVALALPVQGLAAARMTHCLAGSAPTHGPAHDGSPAPAAHGGHRAGDAVPAHDVRHGVRHDVRGDHLGHAHGESPGHDQVHDHGHDRAQAGPEQATASSPPHDDAGAGHAPSAGQKCSACAACCAATAPWPHIAELPVLDLASAPRASSDACAASVVAPGLERPPRLNLA